MTSGLRNPELPPFELEVENKLDRLLAQAEDVDRNIDRLLTQAGLDMTSVRDPETSVPTIVQASSEAAQRIGNGNVESNTHQTPSASARSFPPFQPSIAADALRSSMAGLGTRYLFIRAATPESTARGSRENARLAFLESLPILPASDHPEALDTCHICQEAFDNTARPEVPVRLPCHHVFGALCISTWMSIQETCPLCRTVLFDPDPIDTSKPGWTARFPRPVRAPGLPRSVPLMQNITGGSLEANIRRFERHNWELAEQSGWLLWSRAPLESSPNMDDMLALIDTCLRSIKCLRNTLSYRNLRYRSVIWAEATR